MTEYVTTTPGLYPLPDHAKDELGDLKGRQTDDLVDGDEPAEVREVYASVREDLVDLQAEAGLDLIVEGQTRWDDMLAHPLSVSDAVETRGIERYYDNNNFYRDPAVVDDLEPTGDVAAELEAATAGAEDLQAVLPGPYSLSELATDEHYGDDAAFLDAVAEFLAGEVERFPEHATAFLLEPSLVTDPPGESAARASEAIDAVAGATDADVVVHTYFGAFDEETYAHLLDAGVDGVGYDLVAAPDETADLVREYGIPDDVALGVLDGENTRVESPSTIRDRVEWFEDRLPEAIDPETVYVTPNTELFHLPVSKFEAKLDALGAAFAEVQA
ncbi:MAG: 5-methyltetrahydropteroyltriglutamate--homocysteine methyltransferase [Halobacteriales archaeon]